MRGKFVTTQIWITCLSSQRSKINAGKQEKANEQTKEEKLERNNEETDQQEDQLRMVA